MNSKTFKIRTYTIGRTHFAECENLRFGKAVGTITMTGSTQEIAKEKLELCIANKPYKHLDNMKK